MRARHLRFATAMASVLAVAGCGFLPTVGESHEAWLSTCAVGVDTMTGEARVAQSAIEQGFLDEAAYAVEQGRLFFASTCLPAPTPDLTRVVTDIVNAQSATVEALRAGDLVRAAHYADGVADSLQQMQDMVGDL